MRNVRTWIELSRSALQYNLTALRSVLGPEPAIAPVVKANAYGHGWPEIIRMLSGAKIWGVCVAYGQEALALREAGWRKPILVLSYWAEHEVADLVRHKIDLVVWDFPSLAGLLGYARSHRRPVGIHLKLDSGTTRIGFRREDLAAVRTQLSHRAAGVTVAGIFSHLANSEESTTRRTTDQIHRFTTLSNELGVSGEVIHLACTAAALRYPTSRFDLVRYGIGLYGLWPSRPIQTWAMKTLSKFRLRPVLSWYSRLIQVKSVASGTSIGYGSTVSVKRQTRIGIVPVGYADGYDRRASNRAWMMVAGRRAPVIGRVSMNLTAVDLTALRSARRGARVTLIGPGVSTDDLANAFGTINYEVVARLDSKIPRIITA